MSSAFVGSIPDYYDRHLGPVLFEPYAVDLARRVPASAQRVLEVAAGTGRVTRHLLEALPAERKIVATDLNGAMLAAARAALPDPRVHWQVVDAQKLPFEADSFDAAVCQFGLMFFADATGALRELRRVVRAGGVALFSTWDALAANGAAALVQELAVSTFAGDAPPFYLTPFSMPDPVRVRALALAAGFTSVEHETLAVTATSESAEHLAAGHVRGNPFGQQLAERGLDAGAFERDFATQLAARFGDHPCRSPMSAHVFSAR